MKKLIAIMMVLAMVFAMNAGALAAESSTPVSFKVDNTQISVTVPTAMAVTVNADGTLTYPTGAKIVNDSVFPVMVTNVAATAEAGWTLAETDDMATDDLITTNIKPGTGTAEFVNVGAVAATDWNMTATDAAGTDDEIALTFESGQIYRLTKTLTTTGALAYTITFTVEAGSHT